MGAGRPGVAASSRAKPFPGPAPRSAYPDALQHPDLLPFVQAEGHFPAAVAALAAPHAGGAAAWDASPPVPSGASSLPAPANIASSHWRVAQGRPIVWRRADGGPRGTMGAVVRRRGRPSVSCANTEYAELPAPPGPTASSCKRRTFV